MSGRGPIRTNDFMKQKTIRNGLYGNVLNGQLVPFGTDKKGRYLLKVDGDAWSWVYPNGKRLETLLSYRGEYANHIRTRGWRRFSKNPFAPKFRTTHSHTTIPNGFTVAHLLRTLEGCDPEAIILLGNKHHGFLGSLRHVQDDREEKQITLFCTCT